MNLGIVILAVFIPAAFVILLFAAVSLGSIFYDDFCDWFEEHGIYKISFCLIVAAIIITAVNIGLLIIK